MASNRQLGYWQEVVRGSGKNRAAEIDRESVGNQWRINCLDQVSLPVVPESSGLVLGPKQLICNRFATDYKLIC